MMLFIHQQHLPICSKDTAARRVEVIGIKNPMSAKEIAEATEKSSLPERFLNK